MTKLYFHAANYDTVSYPGTYPVNQVGGSAPALQGGITPWVYDRPTVDDETVHRSMDTTKGTNQTSIAFTSLSSLSRTYYVTKFISMPLSGVTQINTNTWNTHIAYSMSNLTSSSVRLLLGLYVWRPSTGAIVGSAIYSGDLSFADSTEPNASNAEKLFQGAISSSGTQVTGVSNGDVLIAEVWWRQTTTATSTNTFYFDGATEYASADQTTVSDIASYIETPQTLTFSTAGITTSVTGKAIRTKQIVQKV